MPLLFERQPGSAVDHESGITIPAPRIVPASPPEDPGHSEYQYLFYVDGERVDGLGVLGSERTVQAATGAERIFNLDLGRDWVLRSIFDFKRLLKDTGDQFSFLRSLAQGLVLANMDDSSSRCAVRYVATANAEALKEFGIEIADPLQLTSDGSIVLASVHAPALDT
ncbi:TPA: hypothetical protein QDZ42_000836 [Stenotrophomonas maltophilia]|nr:hypothetical protein [Stenotrophomonas maltophilia]HDS1042213.1 hypothetical protein [Stenotrophomonas maltophilia]